MDIDQVVVVVVVVFNFQRARPISSYLDRTSSLNGGFIARPKRDGTFSCRPKPKSPAGNMGPSCPLV